MRQRQSQKGSTSAIHGNFLTDGRATAAYAPRGWFHDDSRESRAFAIRFALTALLLTQLALFIHPAGFDGGASDDQRYLDLAIGWMGNGPSAGDTHWAMRIPLIATITGAFHVTGPSIATLLAVPRLFYALFIFAGSAAIARWAGRRVAWTWLALICVSPVLHQMATSCYPEIVELALGTASLVAFIAARHIHRPLPRHGLLALSGVALGIGIVTRETIGFLAIGYAWAAIMRPGMPRAGYVSLAAGLALPIVANVAWLWWQTGDPLYRLHIGANHIRIFSAHLKGGVYTGGGPFLNPDLASRWIPAGPTDLFWAINPIGDFLIDPDFGFIFLACLIIALPFVRRGRPLAMPRGALPLLIALAIGCYVMVTWVFTLRPQPRYYLPVIAAAQVALALGLGAMLERPELRRRAIAILSLVLLAGAIPILVSRDKGLFEKAAVAYMTDRPGVYGTAADIAARAGSRARLAGVAPPLAGDPPPGGYRISWLTDKTVARAGRIPPPPPGYRQSDLIVLEKPMVEAIFVPWRWRAMRVEQRLPFDAIGTADGTPARAGRSRERS